MGPRLYRDREDAGRQLAERLIDLATDQPIVFGLVRGGVATAAPIAKALGAPLAPLIVRKIGHPNHPELGLGAIAPDGVVNLDSDLLDRLGINDRDIQAVIEAEFDELERRRDEFDPKSAQPVWDRVCIVVDDGLATGSTAAVAGEYLKREGARRTILAVPVCPPESLARMALIYDRVECLQCISNFRSVGQWYEDFQQLTDRDVKLVLGILDG